MDAARAGVLSDANTRPGTAGRRAVDAVAYDRRQARGRRLGAPTARAAVGHGARESGVSITAMFRGLGFATVEDPTPGERRRLGRWNSLGAQLEAGRLAPKEFERRVRTWKPFRDAQFEWDPSIITATMDERREAGLPTFEYVGRRP